MHRLVIAINSSTHPHRDCAAANIMMDGRPLYPQGHHPVCRSLSPDAVYELVPLSRSDHPVRYYFVDYDISSLFPPGVPPLVVGRKGRDKEVPELSDDIPYDAFKVDVFALGNLFHKEFLEVSVVTFTFRPSALFPVLTIMAAIQQHGVYGGSANAHASTPARGTANH